MIDLLVEFLSHYGLKEADGLANNPEIISMGKEIGYDIKDDSTTPWCSLLMNYVAKKCGYQYTGQLTARSWLKMPVMVLQPSVGDVVILSRGDPKGWEGHVGLFIKWDDKRVWVLGGNQGNEVNISVYQRDRVLGVRKLKKVSEK